jgi:hypothetical protein
MREAVLVALTALVVAAASPISAQSIKTDDNIETDGQLVSKVALGTAPLVVASKTKVVGLNADLLDGTNGGSFALAIELLAAIESLDNPDPPCFDSSARFVNCGNGTWTDTVTGLIWLEDADCFAAMDYAAANAAAAALADGQCNLTDGSRPGDWRLPSREDWEVMVHPSCPDSTPHLVGNGTAGGCYDANPWASDVQANWHFSSTTLHGSTTTAFIARLNDGTVTQIGKTTINTVWPVRGGQ